MKISCKIFLIFLAILMINFSLTSTIFADDEEIIASDITDKIKIEISSGQSVKIITDKSDRNRITLPKDASIKISCDEEISGIYIIWDSPDVSWNLVVGGDTFVDIDTNGYLHQYINLLDINIDRPSQSSDLKSEETLKQLEIRLNDEKTSICEIYTFSKGTPPPWVQIWNPPHEEKTDLMLMSTHADDEHLFFAGILPYYAGEVKARVQVVYFTNHSSGPNKNINRPHELLNGLWSVGVTAYPVISDFPDLFAKSLSGAQKVFNDAKIDEDKIIEFQVEMIRRFKPQVIIGHDINGEYGHGAHMLNALTLQKALELTSDSSSYPDSAESYGTFDVPKTYLHLWKENPIVMDWDKPLESFGGKTAFEVSKGGYDHHKSQHYTWFTDWLLGSKNSPFTKATQIKKYSPCEYGLYRSLVGPDSGKGDFLENIELYKDPVPTTAPTEPPTTLSANNFQTTTPTSKAKAALPISAFWGLGALAVAAVAVLVIILIKQKGRF